MCISDLSFQHRKGTNHNKCRHYYLTNANKIKSTDLVDFFSFRFVVCFFLSQKNKQICNYLFTALYCILLFFVYALTHLCVCMCVHVINTIIIVIIQSNANEQPFFRDIVRMPLFKLIKKNTHTHTHNETIHF